MSAIRISQVVAFSRTHSVHLNPRIEGTEKACPEFSGGRFCQVVARTGSTLFQLFLEIMCSCFFIISHRKDLEFLSPRFEKEKKSEVTKTSEQSGLEPETIH